MEALRLEDPSEIGGYPLLGRLGAGGMGQVYLGLTSSGRHVALKVIREDFEGPTALARFRREVATVERVRSRFAAAMVGAGLDAPPYWLATEYVPGPTLRQAVAAHGPLPPETCLRLLVELAQGLLEIHRHGVQHRDLKPGNVILAPDGPRLIDFGIARGEGQTQITQTGAWNGTPGFVAPEVVREQQPLPASDVFSLAGTVAYAATGRPRSAAAASRRSSTGRSAARSTWRASTRASPAWSGSARRRSPGPGSRWSGCSSRCPRSAPSPPTPPTGGSWASRGRCPPASRTRSRRAWSRPTARGRFRASRADGRAPPSSRRAPGWPPSSSWAPSSRGTSSTVTAAPKRTGRSRRPGRGRRAEPRPAAPRARPPAPRPRARPTASHRTGSWSSSRANSRTFGGPRRARRASPPLVRRTSTSPATPRRQYRASPTPGRPSTSGCASSTRSRPSTTWPSKCAPQRSSRGTASPGWCRASRTCTPARRRG
ncbi:protein kinase [Actinomadura luteofluorescens]|uniref:protein kinase domain-containing protein n=1 Tax=Actinomadura luteofluorescens TaxID=46163 RepID=UPI003628A6FE